MKEILDKQEIANLIGLIIISSLIWFVAPLIKITGISFLSSPTVRLMIISSLFIFWCAKIIMYFALESYTKHATAKNLLSGTTSFAINSSIFKRNILILTKAFRSNYLGFLRKRKYNTKIPLFFVIGPSSSGKTAILEKSNILPFSLAPHVQKALADLTKMNIGTWWLTQEGIFLEINIESVDIKMLSAVLNIFTHHRFSSLLHGIIVTQPIDQFMTDTNENITTNARLLNSYLFSLYQVLKTQVPLYLMITKMDKISGFYEYFTVLTDEERSLSFGYTIQAREQPTIDQLFSASFDSFLTSLQSHFFCKISLNNTPVITGHALNFPQQLHALKKTFQEFIHTLFNGEFIENPYTFYGIYFSSTATTSPLQPINYYLSSLKEVLPLKNEDTSFSVPEAKNYFLKNFFKEHIFAGTPFITNKQPQHLLRHYTRQAFYIISSSLLLFYVLFCGFLTIEMKNNMQGKNEVLNTYFNISHQEMDTLTKALPHLEPLRLALQNDKYIHLTYLPVHPVLYKIDHIINKTLLDAIRIVYTPLLFQHLESLLAKEQESTKNLVMLLKAYLAFGIKTKHKQDIIRVILSKNITSTYKNTPQLCNTLLWYLNKTADITLPACMVNIALVREKRDILKRSSSLDRIYTSIKEYANKQTPRFFVPANAWDPFFRKIFEENQTFIPILYSRIGYTAFFETKISTFIDEASMDDFSVGISATNTPEIHHEKEIQQSLLNVYINDYLTQWQNFLSGIQILPTPTLEDLIKIISLLSGKEELLLKIMTLATQELAPVSHLTTSSHFVDISDFSGLCDDKGLPKLREAMTCLGQLATELNALVVASDSYKARFTFIKAYYQEDKNNPLYKLQETASKLPSPLKQWLYEIVNRAKSHLVPEAIHYINTVWDKTVYGFYEKNFCQSYPFLKNSPHDLEPNVLKTIFGQTGLLKTFVEEYLKPFEIFPDPNVTELSTESQQYDGFSLNEEHYEILQAALSFSEKFFDETNGINISFQIEPFTMSSELSSLSLTYAHHSLIYRHGPTQLKIFNWPNIDPNNNSCQILGLDFNQNEENIQFDGYWGIFRLIDQSTIKTYKKENNYLLSLPLKHSAQIILKSTKLIQFLERMRILKLPKLLVFNF